jgi:hypothetical protein
MKTKEEANKRQLLHAKHSLAHGTTSPPGFPAPYRAFGQPQICKPLYIRLLPLADVSSTSAH